jgi:hypothetical protein
MNPLLSAWCRVEDEADRRYMVDWHSQGNVVTGRFVSIVTGLSKKPERPGTG